MKIAIIGYGKMGIEIEKIAIERGHQISSKINLENQSEIQSVSIDNTDVAIEFTSPESALPNITTMLNNGVRVISGSTGWLDQMSLVNDIVTEKNGTFFYASNYSLGVNITFRLNQILASMMEGKGYKVSMEEIHHTQKLDSPSGTAITLAEGILEYNKDIISWSEEETGDEGELPIHCKRLDKVPGTHTVTYNSDEDSIQIKHTAHSRRGFALGAVLVAEWIQNKSGFLTMDDYFDFSL